MELYDLRHDPHEREDLAQRPEHAATVRALSDKLWAWMERVGDPILEGPLPTPYYREAMQDYRERFRG